MFSFHRLLALKKKKFKVSIEYEIKMMLVRLEKCYKFFVKVRGQYFVKGLELQKTKELNSYGNFEMIKVSGQQIKVWL